MGVVDILGLGGVAVDDLLSVDGYLPPDAKTPVLRRERQRGGLTATALVAAVGAALDWPPAEVIQSCRVLFVDSIGLDGMLRASTLTAAAGIPIVADIEATGGDPMPLLQTVDHLILSWQFVGRAGDPL